MTHLLDNGVKLFLKVFFQKFLVKLQVKVELFWEDILVLEVLSTVEIKGVFSSNFESYSEYITLNEYENAPTELAFCYQNCSDLLWEKICKFSAFSLEFQNLKQFIQTVKGQNNFW